MIGTTLSHFRITAMLGEGGMGEVYRAEDTKLGREVAVKVLPEAFVADPERLGRFEREAKVLASLNHPNIAGIHEVGEQDGTHFLVMELAPGETLADRLVRGPIPADEATAIALQVTRGLEAAHERGVVHRDLKPGNVMVDAKGGVKILDFGLAKALQSEPGDGSAAELAHSPTLTYQATVAGALLGTAAYMSPEQARGEAADRRADVWSFGVLLWEMLTGRRLFEGRTVSDTLAGILRDDIDVATLPATCPSALSRLLRRCLERDPDRRLHDIADARIVLEDVEAGTIDDDPRAAPAATARRSTEKLAWALAALALAVAGASWLGPGRNAEPIATDSVRSFVLPPEGTVFELRDKHVLSVAMSPDGSRLAFSALDPEDRSRRLYVRSLDSTVASPVAGTEDAVMPFWSPDGRHVAFFAEGKLRRVEVGGGAALTICTATDGRGGSWSPDGEIVFTPSASDPIFRVVATGGTPTPVTELTGSETTHRFPFFLPDGRRFLFTTTDSSENHSISVGSLDDADRRLVAKAGSNAVYSDEHVLFVRDGLLLAQPFDLDQLALGGAPTPVAENVFYNTNLAAAAFSASENRHLIFYQEDVSEVVLSLVDRRGRELTTLGDPAAYTLARVSPDGRRLVVERSEGDLSESDLWIFDFESGGRTRLTFEPGRDSNPVWSPDGRQIAYSAGGDENRGADIYVRDAAGGGERELLLGAEANDEPWDWSPDGRHLLFNRSLRGPTDIWALPLDGGEASPLVASPATDGWAHFSPDGQWVAWLSNESGTWQIYATRFPDGSGRWQLTSDADGGYWIIDWIGEGSGELYHVTSDQFFSVLEVRIGDDSIGGGPRERLFPIGAELTWAVDAEATRFVIGRTEGHEVRAPLTLVTNWRDGLR